MKKIQWIFAAAACVVCLGLGFGAGMLLAPHESLGQSPLPINPMATSDTPVLGADAPVDTQALGAGAPATGAQSGSADALAAYIDTLGNNPSQAQQQLFYMALSGMESELSQYAERVRPCMKLEQDLRVLITELKDSAPSGDEKAEFPQEAFDDITAIQTGIVAMIRTYNDEIDTSISVKPGDMLGSAEWQGVIGELESLKNVITDLKELSQYDLQNAYQDYSQAVSTLANNQKQMYDDAMNILNNLKQ